jgi:hypothetical protein
MKVVRLAIENEDRFLAVVYDEEHREIGRVREGSAVEDGWGVPIHAPEAHDEEIVAWVTHKKVEVKP